MNEISNCDFSSAQSVIGPESERTRKYLLIVATTIPFNEIQDWKNEKNAELYEMRLRLNVAMHYALSLNTLPAHNNNFNGIFFVGTVTMHTNSVHPCGFIHSASSVFRCVYGIKFYFFTVIHCSWFYTKQNLYIIFVKTAHKQMNNAILSLS